MIKIDLDGIEKYKKEAVSAKTFIESAKSNLESASSLMNSIGIGADELSLYNTSYDAAAMEVKRQAIVSDLSDKAEEIDTLLASLIDITTKCNSYVEDVENDENEIIKLLGNYASDDYGELEIEEFTENNDIMTFDMANCDYYVCNDGVKIYVNIPYSKHSEEMYKVLTVQQGSYIKKLYDFNDDYSVVLVKNNKDKRVRIGYIKNDDMKPVFAKSDGTPDATSNLDDTYSAYDGYGVVKKKEVNVRPYPNSDQGEETSRKHSSSETFMAKLEEGTVVKIVGQWLNDEQDARRSYLVTFSSDNGNFMGFVDGEDIETGNGKHSYTIKDVSPIVINKDTTILNANYQKVPVKAGTPYKFETDGWDGGYVVSYTENNEEIYAYVSPEDGDRVEPDSISKIGY